MKTNDVTLLVADIGGTNARFALARVADGRVEISALWRRPASDFGTFAEALAAYRRETPGKVDGAVAAAAGPVLGGEIKITNGDWRIRQDETSAQLGGAPVMLANDFEAMARSAPALSGDGLEVIVPGRADPEGDMAVAGPGTGLGVAGLRRLRPQSLGAGWVVVGGEGGHQVFAPQTELEWRLAERLTAAHGYVSNELIASGSGLDETLPALAAVMGVHAPSWSKEEAPHQLDLAAKAGETLAVEMYRLRARTVMTALGDTALAMKATAGAFVAGGIGQRLADWLKAPDAIARFRNRGAQTSLMADIPVWLIREDTAPLIGAALLWVDQQGRGWR